MTIATGYSKIQRQSISVYVRNNRLRPGGEFNLVCSVTTDTYLPVDSFVYRVKGDFEQPVSFVPPAPGFYRITLYGEQQGVKSDFLKFNMGYCPEQIISPVDVEPDFDQFWETTLKELSEVVPDYRMTLLEEKSQGAKNIYRWKCIR